MAAGGDIRIGGKAGSAGDARVSAIRLDGKPVRKNTILKGEVAGGIEHEVTGGNHIAGRSGIGIHHSSEISTHPGDVNRGDRIDREGAGIGDEEPRPGVCREHGRLHFERIAGRTDATGGGAQADRGCDQILRGGVGVREPGGLYRDSSRARVQQAQG